MRRVSVYIDGQNYFHLLQSFNLHARSFNYRRFSEEFLCGENGQRSVQHIKYYGARYPREVDPRRHHLDDVYYQSLQNLNIQIIEGRFRIDNINGTLVPREKGVDVRLATDLVVDAFHNCFDDAYILSGDTDIIPAVKEVLKRVPEKRIYCCVGKVYEIQKQAYSGFIRLYRQTAKRYIEPKAFLANQKSLDVLRERFAPVS